jgi:hypothetical protein
VTPCLVADFLKSYYGHLVLFEVRIIFMLCVKVLRENLLINSTNGPFTGVIEPFIFVSSFLIIFEAALSHCKRYLYHKQQSLPHFKAFIISLGICFVVIPCFP